jgi:hypothetical protein
VVKESKAMLCVLGFKMRPVFVASKKINAIVGLATDKVIAWVFGRPVQSNTQQHHRELFSLAKILCLYRYIV